jgi:hypothetical protein
MGVQYEAEKILEIARLVFMYNFYSNFLDTFLQVITKAHRTPVEKFEFPLTSNQDYGWNTQPLVRVYINCKLYTLCFQTAVTGYGLRLGIWKCNKRYFW